MQMVLMAKELWGVVSSEEERPSDGEKVTKARRNGDSGGKVPMAMSAMVT
jgi:hypothetical protein